MFLQDSHSDKSSSVTLPYHYFSLIIIKKKIIQEVKFNIFCRNVSANLVGFWIKFYLLVIMIRALHLANIKTTIMDIIAHN